MKKHVTMATAILPVVALAGVTVEIDPEDMKDPPKPVTGPSKSKRKRIIASMRQHQAIHHQPEKPKEKSTGLKKLLGNKGRK